MTWTVGSLAAALALEFRGDAGRPLARVAPLDTADAESLAFVARAAYAGRLGETRAGAVIVPPDLADQVPTAAIVSPNPHASYARAAQLLYPDPTASGRRASSARIAGDAQLAADVDVGEHALIESGARVGAGSIIGPGCIVGHGAVLGEGCRLIARVVIAAECRLGDRVRIQPGAVIGGDGFGFAHEGERWVRVPQMGRVVIGSDVEIGANTTIDRGALDDTVIGDGVILDNQIQVAHNVRIGDHTAIAGCVGIAGSATIGRRCLIGGGAGIVGHLEICDDVQIAAMSLVNSSITQPGRYASGTPLDEHARWTRNAVRFRQLEQLQRRIRALEEDKRPDSTGRKRKKP